MRILISLLALALLAVSATACEYSLGALTQCYAAPAQKAAIEYRYVAPLLVQQSYGYERLEVRRDPVVVERQVQQVRGYGYAAPVLRQQVIVKEQKVLVPVQKVRAPQVIKQETVERRGLFGRRSIRQNTVIVNP